METLGRTEIVRPRSERRIERAPPSVRRRIALLVATAAVTVAVGAAAGFVLTDMRDPTPRASASRPARASQQPTGQAWYLTQTPPPTMVRVPDEPIFPDPMETPPDGPLRAYEEALPKDVYVPVKLPATALPRKKPEGPSRPIRAETKDDAHRYADTRIDEPRWPVETADLPPAREAPEPRADVSRAGAAPTRPVPDLFQDAAAVAARADGRKAIDSASPAETDRSSQPQWRRYAVPAPDANGRPRIVMVIDDMGVDRKRSRRIIDLRPALTLAFLTYAPNLEEQTDEARAAGHELLVHVAMEPGNPIIDSGPNPLLTGLRADEIRLRLEWGLAAFAAHVGINNHMGSKFTRDEAAMTVVMEELKRRGLMFLDSRTSNSTVGPGLARRLGVPYAERNVFIDDHNDIQTIQYRLSQVERLADQKGFAIAIGHPRESTLQVLGDWLDGLDDKGYALVPLTNVVDDPERVGQMAEHPEIEGDR